jgi:hypothetical protein
MTYPSKPPSAPAIPFNAVGRSKNLNDIVSAIAVEKLLALKTDGTYDDNFSIGDNTLNALVNEINIRLGSTIKEYDSTGANLLRTLTLGSATNLVQGFRYLDDPIKISNNATNPTTQIDVSAGVMNFDDGTGQVRLATSLTKSTANDFANGGLLPNGTVLQTGTIYYVFAIYSSTSNLVSFYADTSKTSPTLPTSPNVYDKKQLRGAFYVNIGGNIEVGDFECTEDYCEFAPKTEITTSLSSSSTTPTNVFIKGPANSITTVNLFVDINTSGTLQKYVRVYPTTSNDDTVDVNNSQATAQRGSVFENPGNSQIQVKCDSNSRVRVKSNSSITNQTRLTLVRWRLKLKD